MSPVVHIKYDLQRAITQHLQEQMMIANNAKIQNIHSCSSSFDSIDSLRQHKVEPLDIDNKLNEK